MTTCQVKGIQGWKVEQGQTADFGFGRCNAMLVQLSVKKAFLLTRIWLNLELKMRKSVAMTWTLPLLTFKMAASAIWEISS